MSLKMIAVENGHISSVEKIPKDYVETFFKSEKRVTAAFVSVSTKRSRMWKEPLWFHNLQSTGADMRATTSNGGLVAIESKFGSLKKQAIDRAVSQALHGIYALEEKEINESFDVKSRIAYVLWSPKSESTDDLTLPTKIRKAFRSVISGKAIESAWRPKDEFFLKWLKQQNTKRIKCGLLILRRYESPGKQRVILTLNKVSF